MTKQKEIDAIRKLEGVPYIEGYNFSKQSGSEQIGYLQALKDLKKEMGLRG